METRRRPRPSADAKPKSDPRSPANNVIPTSRRNGGGGGSAPSTDSLLLRITQLIFLIVVVWFVFLITSVNTAISISSTNHNSNIRGHNVRAAAAARNANVDAFKAKQQIESIRNEFYNRYGGKEEATAMLSRGLKSFAKQSSSSKDIDSVFTHDSLKGTATRFLSLLKEHELHPPSGNNTSVPFILSFGGYSVTVGRGNHFSQSFPFVFQRIIRPLLLSSLNIDLIIRNSAIGGIPSFPYGWCLPNFLGRDSHGISWDYGMNEGNGGEGLESYLRNGLSNIKQVLPMFVMVDMKKTRMNVLQYYVENGSLVDPLALGRASDAVKNKEWLDSKKQKQRPIGFQNWEEWGAPKGAPGQSPWHPKKMEHELMGWMLAMYFVDSVEMALEMMNNHEDWKESLTYPDNVKEAILPPPMTDVTGTGVPTLLHGVRNGNTWKMPRVSCRTSFLPNISGHLESIIVSGLTKDDEDMIKPRADSLFDGGWVMDIGKMERETKEKVNKYGGLGYIDMKTSLYGIQSSGVLKLWLPHEDYESTKINAKNGYTVATEYFQSTVFCEVNEKRGSKECNMLSDLEFRIGGTTISKDHVKQIHGVASYLKKDICIHVEIPTSAQVSFRDAKPGLDVEMSVVNSEVSRENGACSISHVIWQHT
ncbi:hypothetical protein ACHAXN_001231 [Cyclotella atomus]